jgi:short subunit dehydrogenase-like uncharacterized protein
MCKSDEDQKSTNLRLPIEKDGKFIPAVSTGTFLAALTMVPLWATVVLPLTTIFQIGKAIVKPLFPKPKEPKFDSGYVVDAKDITPRPERKYDVVVVGVTGFAGRLGARHLAKTYGVNQTVQWAIAGRSQAKLDKVKKELAEELGMPEILNVDTILVDTSDASTMPALVRDTRAVVSTVGPFSLYGSAVVEFCAKFGTHYADITGEITWVQKMAAIWETTAQQTGAKIVSLCGHDSIPWDLMTYKVAQILKEEKGEDLASITVRNECRSAPSGGTLLTMSLGMAGKLAPAPATDPFLAKSKNPDLKVVNNLPLIISKTILPSNGQTKYISPFVMALVNMQVVEWSQALRGSSIPLTYSEYSIDPDFKTAFVSYFRLIGFFTAVLNPITASLLEKFVLEKPGGGPSMDTMENEFFLVLHADGVGSKGTQAEAVMYFSQDPGYLETARMVVETGLGMALTEDQLPIQEGGFWTPSVALGDVLLKRLQDTGTYFVSRLKSTN